MAVITARARRLLLITVPVLIFLTLFAIHSDSLPEDIDEKLPTKLTGEPAGYDPKAKPIPLRKPIPEKPPEIVNNFPSIPSWNKPPRSRSKHATPLFTGFTRNWCLLQQTVDSYIVA